MNGLVETKSEIRARIDELKAIVGVCDRSDGTMSGVGNDVPIHVEKRIAELEKSLESADEDLSSSIIRSHKAICEAKRMGEKDAYGNDPAMYYTLGICGEAGEMANAIVKARRNGEDQARVLEAVKSELPDVIVYSHVLAHVLDINLSQLVNDKVEVVIQRARDGYYGKPLR